MATLLVMGLLFWMGVLVVGALIIATKVMWEMLKEMFTGWLP